MLKEGNPMKKFHVVIKSFIDDHYRYVITSKPVSAAKAMKVEDGASINMNHDKYYVDLEEVKTHPKSGDVFDPRDVAILGGDPSL